MGRHANPRAKKVKNAAKVQDTGDKLKCEAHNEDRSKHVREAKSHRVVSVSSESQNGSTPTTPARDASSPSQNGTNLVMNGNTNADGVSEMPHISNGISHAAAFQRADNSPYMAQQSPGFPDTFNALKSSQPGAIDDTVLQLLLEQQRAKRQDMEHQLRLIGRIPNNQSLNVAQASQGNSKASEDPTLGSEATLNHLTGGGQQHFASALDAMQHMHQLGPVHDDVLRHLLRQQRLLSLERTMQAGNRSAYVPQPNGLHSPFLANKILPTTTSNGTGERFGFFPLSENNKDQLRRFQALSTMPPPHQLMHSSNLSALERFTETRSVGLRGQMFAATAPTSYDLVPATPHNEELAQRAHYLVHLSQADMSTWRNTRRRFRQKGGHVEDDEDSSCDSKPRSRKKKAKI